VTTSCRVADEQCDVAMQRIRHRDVRPAARLNEPSGSDATAHAPDNDDDYGDDDDRRLNNAEIWRVRRRTSTWDATEVD